MWKKGWITGLFMLALGVAADVTLAERLNYRIVLPDNPTAIEKAAGEELQSYLEKIYAKPVRLDGAEPRLLVFRVGFSAGAVKDGFTDLPPVNRFPAGFGVFRRGDTILIYGEDTPELNPWSERGNTGTLLGVYYFLRRYAGVCFFAPGEQGFRLTPEAPLAMPEPNDLPKPTFEVRGFYTASRDFKRADIMKFFKQSLCRVPDWAAAQSSYIILNRWNKRFKDRPELFAMHNGKRFNASYPYHMPCLSNPDVLTQIASDLIEQINRKRSLTTIRLFCDAPYTRCECENCRKSPVTRYVRENNNSEEIYTFINKVAKTVRQAYPDVVFMTQTKGSSYNTPPQSEPLQPDLTVEILTERPKLVDYRKYVQQCIDWEKAGAKTMLKSYPRYPDWKDYPIINPQFTARYFRTFAGVTRGSKHSDYSYSLKVPYSFCALNLYVQTAILFDVNRQTDDLVAEFCSAAYPGAEAEMREFYRIMEELLGNNSVWGDPLLEAYLPDRLLKPSQLLEAAAGKVKQRFWLERLRLDFEAFRAKVEKRRPELTDFAARIAEFRQAQEANRQLTVPETGEPRQLSFFPLNPYREFQSALAKLSYRQDGLRLQLTARENLLRQLVAKCRENHQGAMWDDDCFELMLAPSQREYPYLQIIVNSTGNYRIFSRTGPNVSKELNDAALEVKAEVGKDGWQVDLTVPPVLLKTVMDNGSGRIGLFRTRPARGSGGVQQSGIRITGKNYHDLKEYSSFEIKSLQRNWLERTFAF